MSKLDNGEKEVPESSADKDAIVPSTKTDEKKKHGSGGGHSPPFYFRPGGKSYCGMDNFSQIALLEEKTAD